jgi:hypothetical protein
VRLPKWSWAPFDISGVQRKNYRYVQIDAIAIGVTSAAAPFLPVFLTRLGATNFQVGLLTAMPGVTGLLLAMFIGRFLQGRRNIVPWFSASRLLVVSAYAATGLSVFVVPQQYLVATILAIWALATIPQISLNVCFSVVMNAVAGPAHRYDLMSRRWSILGLTNAVAVALAGQMLELAGFPLNYQMVFLGFSLGGLLSYAYSSRISLPDTLPAPALQGNSAAERSHEYFRLIWRNRDFTRFASQRFIYQSGMSLAIPLFPLYFVKVVQASDAAIGAINMAQTVVLTIGYFFWTRQSRKHGSRLVLLSSTLGLALYPALVASTQAVNVIIVLAALAGIFQAGIDLVFFDELMKTVPVEYSATFVSVAQSLQYASTVIAPLVGTWVATSFGLGWALGLATVVRLIGFLLFALWRGESKLPAPQKL